MFSFSSLVQINLTEGKETQAGESWCPDCTIGDPIIRKVLCKLESCGLLECPIERSAYKEIEGKCSYKYDEEIQLKKIPTLMFWQPVIFFVYI